MKKLLTIISGLGIVALLVVFFWGKAPEAKQTLGAITSPEITENHISVNGVTTWTLRTAMNTATTTLCSFPNPAGLGTSTNANGTPITLVGMATSSLQSVSVLITGGTTTAMAFDISTSSLPWASTSTPAFAYGVSVPSGAQYSSEFRISSQGNATSSDARLTSSLPRDNNTIGPVQYVVVQTAGPGLGGYTYTGQCIATFKSLSAF